MKFHPASTPPVTGPVVTGRNSEVSTPTSFDPAKAYEDSYQPAAFQIAWPIVQKSLEQFLSGARFGRNISFGGPRIASALRLKQSLLPIFDYAGGRLVVYEMRSNNQHKRGRAEDWH
jgi:hypothetical protein